MDATTENFSRYQTINGHINSLLYKIKKDTSGNSFLETRINHPAFKELTDMGDIIVNYLFHLITEHGGDWIIFLLLNSIVSTDKQPVIPKEHNGKFIHILSDWLAWYIESDYYKNNDIYHGLITDKNSLS